jgi:hypothetical protein
MMLAVPASALLLAGALADPPGGDDDDSADVLEEDSAPPPPAPPIPVFSVDQILVDWATLEWQARAIYLASATKKPREDHPYDWCFDPVKAIYPNAGIPLPRELCVSPWDIPVDMLDPDGPTAAWVLTVGRDEEQVYAVQACGETTDTCAALARESMVEGIRCWQLDRAWSDIPPAATRCAQDEHCTLFQAAGNCFRRGMSTLTADPYAELLERFGPPCGYSIMGACPEGDWRVKCRQGVCTVEDRNAPPPPPVPVELEEPPAE